MAGRARRRAASKLIAVHDANVLIPAAPHDTLLRAAKTGLYRLAWSDEILTEVGRNLVDNGLTSAADARDLIATMREYFPEALIAGYERLVPRMTNDPKDRHVLAVAVRAEAQVIVTQNLRDFPEEALMPWRIEAWSLDAFLTHLVQQAPARMARIIREQAADLIDPPISVDELLAELKPVAPAFVERIATRFLGEAS
jgi:predicted nucleic acid-binding protein